MNHKKCNLTKLFNELQTYETLIYGKGGKANVVEANAIDRKTSSSKKKRKTFMNKKKSKKRFHKKQRKTVESKSKEKCFHCNQDDHRKER